MAVVRVCDNCGGFVLANASKCRLCGEEIYPISKEVELKANLTEALLEKVMLQTGDLSPMAILSTETDENEILFHIKGDGKEAEIQHLAEIIRNNDDLVTVLIAIRLDLPDVLAQITECNDGLCVFTLSEDSAIKDIIPLVRNDGRLQFGNAVIRFDITDDFETMGILSVLYEAFLGV